MLVLSMNSKRQRRPSVRLGEVGDMPASFACGLSHNTKKKLGFNRSYANDMLNHHHPNPINELSGHMLGFPMQARPDFLVLDPSSGVSSGLPADLQHNRENKDPNSSKSAFENASSDEMDLSKMKFNFGGCITKKCRVMKRRGRSNKGTSDNITGSVWSSKLSPHLIEEDIRESADKNFTKYTSDEFNDYYAVNGFKDFSEHEKPATSKEACEFDIDSPAFDTRQGGSSNEFWQEDACDEGNNAYSVSDHGWDEMDSGGVDFSAVSRWLEDQGFGEYAGIFELHEVDEAALPLLTIEDLKEMGMLAVGPRRKLYTAIQQLRKEGYSDNTL